MTSHIDVIIEDCSKIRIYCLIHFDFSANILEETMIWLDSSDERMAWLESVDVLDTNGWMLMDENLKTQLNSTNQCLGVIIREEISTTNVTAKLTSMDCNKEASLMCSLPATQFTIPLDKKKLPCLPKNTSTVMRRKRKSETKEEEEESQNRGKLRIYF